MTADTRIGAQLKEAVEAERARNDTTPDMSLVRADPRRTNFEAATPKSYDDWLRINHPDDWRATQPEALARYEAHMAFLTHARLDADDEAKYGRGFSAEDN